VTAQTSLVQLYRGWRRGHDDADRDAAIGAQVTRIRLAVDRTAILFDLADGRRLVAGVEGDCCSQTEILHLSGVKALLRYPIILIRDDALPETVDRPESEWPQESEAKYGLTIATTGGAFTLDYRNYSNGYYGGSLAELSADDVEKTPWRDVTEDE
jgi:hypothetical protein